MLISVHNPSATEVNWSILHLFIHPVLTACVLYLCARQLYTLVSGSPWDQGKDSTTGKQGGVEAHGVPNALSVRDGNTGTEKQKDDGTEHQDQPSKRVAHVNTGWNAAGNRMGSAQGGTTGNRLADSRQSLKVLGRAFHPRKSSGCRVLAWRPQWADIRMTRGRNLLPITPSLYAHTE